MVRLYTTKKYNGLDSERPESLPAGDTYFSNDTQTLWEYNESRQAVQISGGSGGGVQTVVAGANVTVDDTDPENPIVSALISGGGGSITQYANMTALRAEAVSPTDKTLVYLNEHTQDGLGGGEFLWDATDTTADDNGVHIKLDTIVTGRFVRVVKDGTVSVEDFGAVAVASPFTSIVSSARFKEARDYLVSQNGGTLVIPKRGDNRFVIGVNASPLGAANWSNITVNGGGKIFTPVNAITGGVTRGSVFGLADGTDNFKIYDLDVLQAEGNQGDGGSHHGFVFVDDSANVSASRIRIEKVKLFSEAREASALGTSFFVASRFSDEDLGFVEDVSIIDCEVYIEGVSSYGIKFTKKSRNIFINNNTLTFTESVSTPNDAYNMIAIYGDAEDAVITNNKCYGSGHSAIATSTSRRAIITNNFVYNDLVTSEAGIECEYKGGHGTVGFQAEDFIVSNNYVNNCYMGILIADRINDATSTSPKNIIVSSNIVKNSTLSDIEITSEFSSAGNDTTRISNVIVSNNICESSASNANISSRDGSNLKIINNILSGGLDGIHVGRNSSIKVRGDVDISGNTIRNYNTFGVRIETADEIQLSITNNKCYGGQRGIHSNTDINLSGTSSAIIMSNYVEGTSSDGYLFINHNIVGVQIAFNTAYNCGDKGFETSGTSLLSNMNISRGCVLGGTFSGTDNIQVNNITL
jgi:hypothetical protein